jgi:hypothetical protein
MAEIVQILEDSFKLLMRKPRLFVPKIFSTLTASLFLVFLLSSPSRIAQMNPVNAISLMVGALFMLSLLGVYSSMMLSSMVKSSNSSLYASFIDVLGKYSNVLKASTASITAGLGVGVVFTAGYWLYLSTGNPVYIFLAGFFFLSSVIAISYLGYFLPVTLLVEKNFKSAFGSSMKSTGENRKVVLVLLLFSVALIGLAFFSAGFLEKLGYIGFVVGRLVSSVANTYIFTVSPTYYFESSGSKSFQ